MSAISILIGLAAVGAIVFLVNRFSGCSESCSGLVTQTDLDERLKLYMKESEVKALVATASGKSEEAFGEIGTRLSDMQKQIDDLIAGATDPDVTDEAFLADLNKLKEFTDKLADVVPTPEARKRSKN